VNVVFMDQQKRNGGKIAPNPLCDLPNSEIQIQFQIEKPKKHGKRDFCIMRVTKNYPVNFYPIHMGKETKEEIAKYVAAYVKEDFDVRIIWEEFHKDDPGVPWFHSCFNDCVESPFQGPPKKRTLSQRQHLENLAIQAGSSPNWHFIFD